MLFQLYKSIAKHYQESTFTQTLRNYVPYIYSQQAPNNTEYPCIVFEDVTSEVTNTMCSDIESFDIKFNIYSKTSYESLWLQEQLKYGFANKLLVLDSETISPTLSTYDLPYIEISEAGTTDINGQYTKLAPTFYLGDGYKCVYGTLPSGTASGWYIQNTLSYPYNLTYYISEDVVDSPVDVTIWELVAGQSPVPTFTQPTSSIVLDPGGEFYPYSVIQASIQSQSSEYDFENNVFNKPVTIRYTIREN